VEQCIVNELGEYTMKADKVNNKIGFDQLFGAMVKDKRVSEMTEWYLYKKRKIDKTFIYNELLSKRLIGYSPERKSLSFPLMRGFLIVGIQYLAIEPVTIMGKTMKEGQEYWHEGSDIDTGLFSIQKSFREVIITNGILDLLSTGMGGVSVPNLTRLKQLQLFSDMKATVCFKNTVGRDSAVNRVLEILPKARIVMLPEDFKDINHLLIGEGRGAVNALLKKGNKVERRREPIKPKKDETFEALRCRYFAQPGPHNTHATLEAALERARTLNIKKMLVSSCSGATAHKALDVFGKDFSVIIVTHATGFKKSDYQEMPEQERKILIGRGAHVLTAQHAFSGVGRALRNKTGTYQIDEIIAYTLRTFGQGTKVAIEIALMAADAGLIRTDEDVISIGGTAHGVDTALLLRGANAHHFFDLKVKEIICKPSDF
jgi:hypothetical protein